METNRESETPEMEPLGTNHSLHDSFLVGGGLSFHSLLILHYSFEGYLTYYGILSFLFPFSRFAHSSFFSLSLGY